MTTPARLLRAMAALLLAAAASSAQATIVVYTSQAAFLAAIGGAATDSFDDLSAGTLYDGPLARSAGGFGYSAGAGPVSSMLFGAGTKTDSWLSSGESSDTITFSGFSGGVSAAGANVFGSNLPGHFRRASVITVSATDADGSVTRTLTQSTRSTFIGFVSDQALSSLTVAASQGRFRSVWPTVNDLILAAPVPEPQGWALLAGGLAVVGLAARRRPGR